MRVGVVDGCNLAHPLTSAQDIRRAREIIVQSNIKASHTILYEDEFRYRVGIELKEAIQRSSKKVGTIATCKDD